MRLLKEASQRSSVDIFENVKIQVILKKMVHSKSHVHFDVIAENHLAIFYPLPYFDLDVINKSL